MTLGTLSRAAAFVAFAALSLTAGASQSQSAPQAAPGTTNMPVSCPTCGSGMTGQGMRGQGMMPGQGAAANWQEMRDQMQAMNEDMVKLRQEMHRQR